MGYSTVNRIWAEDGPIFLSDALHGSIWENAFAAYAGYLHVPARLVAEVIAALPVGWWAAAIALISALIRVGIAIVAWFATSEYLHSRYWRYAVSFVVVTLPSGSPEVLNNLANLHWFLMFGAVLCSMWTTTTKLGLASRTLVLGAATLADPVTALVVVILLWRAIKGRRVHEWIALGVVLACAFLQGLAVLGGSRGAVLGVDISTLFHLYSLRVLYMSATGTSLAEYLYNVGPFVVLVVVGSVLVLLARGVLVAGPQRPLVAVCTVSSLVLYSVMMAYVPVGGPLVPGDELDAGYTGRYGVTASLLVLVAALAGWAARSNSRRQYWPLLPGFFLTVLYVWALISASLTPIPVTQPGWDVEAARLQSTCLSGAESSNASVEPAPWEFSVPCQSVLR